MRRSSPRPCLVCIVGALSLIKCDLLFFAKTAPSSPLLKITHLIQLSGSQLRLTPPSNCQSSFFLCKLMNVGFRPRLKARPSLYDLVRARNIETLSRTPRPSFSDQLQPELFPLPPSPGFLESPPPSPAPAQQSYSIDTSSNMGPKKEVARDADGEEQYGMSQRLINMANRS